MKCYFGLIRCGDCEYVLSRSIRDFEEALLSYEVGQKYFFHHPDEDEFQLYTVDRILVLPTPANSEYPFAVILISDYCSRMESDVIDVNLLCSDCSPKKFDIRGFIKGF